MSGFNVSTNGEHLMSISPPVAFIDAWNRKNKRYEQVRFFKALCHKVNPELP
jgi:hypothetical protein